MKRTKMQGQEGYSALEVLFGTVITLVLLSGVLYVVQDALATNKIKTAQQNLALTRMKTQQLFAGQSGDYSGLTTTLARSTGVFPVTMIKGSDVKNAWNGDVTLAVDGSDATQFIITYSSVPSDECVKLGTFDLGSWVSVEVGSTTIPSGTTAISTASTACSSESNTIAFTSN